jgi:branched-chain amino acid transport system substrate-binding protein
MQKAGVQVLAPAAPPQNFRNLAASCARQGFRPVFHAMISMIEDAQKDDPNLAGSIGVSINFPYFQSGTPATDEFQTALRTYGVGMTPGLGLTQGWTAGKLFARAAAHLPEPPTNEAVLAGLWSIKNDDLGGITGPLTFTANQPATPAPCWFDLAMTDRWSSPDKFTRHCE